MPIFRKALNMLRTRVLARLETTSRSYEMRIYNNLNNLYKYIRKGDVILIEGQSKMSRIIKLFTKSHWSHVAIYVGDELVERERSLPKRVFNQHGHDARHIIIEAFTGEGVIASPLIKYKDHNIRICRPYGITASDLKAVIDDVIGNIGKNYDDQNIFDLALILLPRFLNPFKQHTIKACLGKCNDFQVICSGMIAKSFQRVGYPIVPALCPPESNGMELQKNPYGSKLIMRHYSQIMPRDFDLSPNFEIIKFNIIKSEHFDYKSLWANNDFHKHLSSQPCKTVALES